MLPKIDALYTRRPNLIVALRELGVVSDSTPVLEGATADDVQGMVLLGSVSPRIARHARGVVEPVMRLTEAERAMTLSIKETIARLKSLWWVEVVDHGPQQEPADIIATRHEALIEYIRREGLAKADAPVEAHAQRRNVEDRHVAGVMPFWIGEAARLVTNVPTKLPQGQQTEISLEDQYRYVGEACFTYSVNLLDVERL